MGPKGCNTPDKWAGIIVETTNLVRISHNASEVRGGENFPRLWIYKWCGSSADVYCYIYRGQSLCKQ